MYITSQNRYHCDTSKTLSADSPVKASSSLANKTCCWASCFSYFKKFQDRSRAESAERLHELPDQLLPSIVAQASKQEEELDIFAGKEVQGILREVSEGRRRWKWQKWGWQTSRSFLPRFCCLSSVTSPRQSWSQPCKCAGDISWWCDVIFIFLLVWRDIDFPVDIKLRVSMWIVEGGGRSWDSPLPGCGPSSTWASWPRSLATGMVSVMASTWTKLSSYDHMMSIMWGYDDLMMNRISVTLYPRLLRMLSCFPDWWLINLIFFWYLCCF